MLGIPTDDEGFVQVATLGKDDAVGLTALSRTETISRAVATSDGRPSSSMKRRLNDGVAVSVVVAMMVLQAALVDGSAVAAIRAAGVTPRGNSLTMRPRSSTSDRSAMPATSSTSEERMMTA